MGNFDRTRAFVEERFEATNDVKLSIAALQAEKTQLEAKLKHLSEKYQATEDAGAELEDFKLLVQAVVSADWHDAEKKTRTYFGATVGCWLRKILTGNRQDKFPSSLNTCGYHGSKQVHGGVPCPPCNHPRVFQAFARCSGQMTAGTRKQGLTLLD